MTTEKQINKICSACGHDLPIGYFNANNNVCYYCEKDGEVCPKCNSTDIQEQDDFFSECNFCGNEWIN